MKKRATHACLLAAVLASAGAARAGLDEAFEALRERALVTEPEGLERRALEAVVRAVDPYGAIGISSPTTNPPPVIERLADGIVYLRVAGIDSGVHAAVAAAFESRPDTNCAGIVLDVRDAAGDGFEDAARIGGLFAAAGAPLFTVYAAGGIVRRDYVAMAGGGACGGAPVMVLVNGGTAGAAEVLVAVLKRQAGVMVLGASTRGDWRVREPVVLPGGEVATVATGYVVPAGGNGTPPTSGLAPDLAVAGEGEPVASATLPTRRFDGRPMSAQAQADRDLMVRVGGDPALRRATEILLGLRALGTRRQVTG